MQGFRLGPRLGYAILRRWYCGLFINHASWHSVLGLLWLVSAHMIMKSHDVTDVGRQDIEANELYVFCLTISMVHELEPELQT